MDKIACNYFGNNHDKTILTLFMQITILQLIGIKYEMQYCISFRMIQHRSVLVGLLRMS